MAWARERIEGGTIMLWTDSKIKNIKLWILQIFSESKNFVIKVVSKEGIDKFFN